MANKKVLFVILGWTCALLLAGCSVSSPAGSGSEPSLSSSAGSAPETVAASGPCANPLYPVVVGATWNYTMTGTTSDTFTRTISSVGEDGFVDQDTFGTGAVRTGQWKCDSGNLIALDPAGGASASVQVNGNTTDFHTTALDGVTLPASVASGDAWTQNVSIAGSMTTNGVSADATNDTSISCVASGMESVTVPAGTFDTMKVRCQDNITITVSVLGTTVPTNIVFTTDSWYVPGTGWVKSLSSGEGLDTTIVLTAYTLP